MSRRVLLRAVLLLVVVLAGALALPDLRWWVYGRLRGEAMYRGKPTSYWREVIHAWPGPQCGPVTLPDRVKKAVGLPYQLGPLPEPLEGSSLAAVPVLVELLNDGDDHDRYYAAYLLGRGSGAPADLPAVVEVVRHGRTPESRCAAIRALQLMEAGGREAIPALEEVFHEKDADELVRQQAGQALQRIREGVAVQSGVK